MVDIPKLRKVVEWVEQQERLLLSEREWFQHSWCTDWSRVTPTPFSALKQYCGTTYCVAGKIAVDAGWVPVWTGPSVMEVQKGGIVAEIPEVAQAELGLTQQEATRLFKASNDAVKVRVFAERIAGEKL